MTPEQLNEWRVIPRAMGFVFMWMSVSVYRWYAAIPEPMDGQGIFAAATIAATVGFCKFYMETGVKND